MHKWLAGLMFVSLAWVAWTGVASAKIYGNARFGYFIDIPAAFSVADPEPENDDGREFHPADKSADLIDSGSWITQDAFAAEVGLYKSLMVEDGWTLTYETKVSTSSAIFSAKKDDRVFYARQITSCGGKAIAGYRLEYLVVDKAKYDGVVRSLNVSLKAGKGSCG